MTYCMHIMVRYELEKQLIAGKLAVRDLPEAWNRLYKQYLGIEVPDDRQGLPARLPLVRRQHRLLPILRPGQRIRSANAGRHGVGNRRYLGRRRQGDLTKVKAWLHEHIHRHAGLYQPTTLFEMACGKFNPQYYTDYLTEKYTNLYHL